MSKKVEIYTWTFCPYCVRAKQLLEQKGVAYTEFKIDNDRAKLQELKKQTGSGSVPQIFVDDKFIGGCDDIYDLDRKGEFDALFL
ncbi:MULTISPECIES: glutaredoxin 3 [unclassified Fusibacter]|uniref:glutaredoxin 3 n=1 Tax=unclassified Fusibacter TaxID=2624464 RepID=UPI0010114C1A|nr:MULTISPECIES: glutaredoxin 3 [unclassified Fusibacter]MCK8060491.1 glutaredoxin 3 [Fusibacter sp. A2]NPE20220.1 glutaredoxin 3 [Fusibacter sp. A1]RXV63428.1 glutaredoxin 3 [Fusibacter sp. A1]